MTKQELLEKGELVFVIEFKEHLIKFWMLEGLLFCYIDNGEEVFDATGYVSSNKVYAKHLLKECGLIENGENTDEFKEELAILGLLYKEYKLAG